MFEYDQHIKIFLELVDEFSIISIDQEQDEDESSNFHEEEEQNPDMKLKNKTTNHKIVQLKNNFIPKCLVPLERLFIKNDVPHKPIIHAKQEDVEKVNIATESEPKNIKLSKLLP